MLDLSRLSAEQRQAVLADDRPLLIVAGPGSGKTTVLAARIAYLITVRQASSATVLALTFASKAARELRARLAAILGDQGQDIHVTTFHAFGLRLIRQWYEALGYGPGPLVVYDDNDVRAILRGLAGEVGIDLKQRSLIDVASDLTHYRLRGRHLESSLPLEALATAYENVLRRRGAVDFPAMLTLPLRLFEVYPDALRHYQQCYQYVLCDEAQDICSVQYALLRQLTEKHSRLTIVGDPCQTIFGWRGADVRFLLQFTSDFPIARLVHLHQNFRSTQHIVALANTLGRPLPYHRPLWTDNSLGVSAQLSVASDGQAEAAFVASEITRLLSQRVVDNPGEIAVLYRTNAQAHELALAFRTQGLPYRVQGHNDLFAQSEVRVALAYLRLAYNPNDAAALTSIVNTPPRQLSQLADLLQAHPASVRELPNLACRYGCHAIVEVERLVALISYLSNQAAELRPAALLDLALDRSGYRAWLSTQPECEARLRYLADLQHVMGQMAGSSDDWLAALSTGEDDLTSVTGEHVLLTTIHAAKGSEWRVVFVTGVEEGLLPHARTMLASPREGDSIEEERRLAYVAVTRPRERLYMTYCRTRHNGGERCLRQPSRFLNGLPLETIKVAV